MRLALWTALLLTTGVPLTHAQRLPALNPDWVRNVDRLFDERPCDADIRESRGLASTAIGELESTIVRRNGRDWRIGHRIPDPLWRGWSAINSADPSTLATTLSAALASREGAAALTRQCGTLSQRYYALRNEAEKVRMLWRVCGLAQEGFTLPNGDVSVVFPQVLMIAATLGHIKRMGEQPAPIERRLMQTMLTGVAPRCGTVTHVPTEEDTPDWLRELPESQGAGQRLQNDEGSSGPNERVQSNACVSCPPGTTNAAGDDASGSNTTSDAVLCAADQRVQSNACVSCPPGTTNAAGDDASGLDTTCDPP